MIILKMIGICCDMIVRRFEQLLLLAAIKLKEPERMM